MAFFFNKDGPVEDCGGAEELVEAPKAIENPTVHCHVARCIGVEDFVAAIEDFVATEGIGAALEEVA